MKRLGEIQKELKAPKNHLNKFGNYKYRNLEDILEALKKVLKEDEFIILEDNIEKIDERFYVKATATFYSGEKSISNTSISTSAYAREPLSKKGMDDSQVTGASSSYARKYALNGLFAIDDTKDADSQNNQSSIAPSSKAARASLLAQIYRLCGQHTKSLSQEEKKLWLFESLEIDDFKKIEKMTMQELQAIKKELEKLGDHR